MNRETFKSLMAVGVLLNSALYLNGVFVAGLVESNPWAWRGALAGFGVTYLSYLLHFAGGTAEWPSAAARGLVWLSIAIGALAGVALLIG